MLPQLECREDRSLQALISSDRKVRLLSRSVLLAGSVRSLPPKLVVFGALFTAPVHSRFRPWAIFNRFKQARTIRKDHTSGANLGYARFEGSFDIRFFCHYTVTGI